MPLYGSRPEVIFKGTDGSRFSEESEGKLEIYFLPGIVFGIILVIASHK